MNKEEIRKGIGLPKDVPILDMGSPDFVEDFALILNTEGSSSDYRNDRDRPYNGQSHTYEGDRGKQLVSGLTIRDIKDCFVIALLQSICPSEKYLNPEEFIKCWDFSVNPPIPTQYLLDKQSDPDYISTKVDSGNWRGVDVYKVDLSKVDPLAISQNLACNIEKMMGIFPNIKTP
jgi:hypothetical protein